LLQISDRTDFTTRLAYFMTAQQHLAKSGIKPTGDSLQESTNKFLDQWDTPDKKPPFSPEGEVVGYIIRSKEAKIPKYFGGHGLFTTEWLALSKLAEHVSDPKRREAYEVVPVRAHV
jgi:hypothetical protein